MNNDDTNEPKGLCGDLTAKLKRPNKSIKMADRSVVGWDTVAEYEADPIAKIQSDKPRIGNLPKGKLKRKRLHTAESTKRQPQISMEQFYPGRLLSTSAMAQ